MFTIELKLKTTPRDRSILDKKFRISRQIYNAMLCECKKRVFKMRNDPNYLLAKSTKDKSERNKIYRELRIKYQVGFNDLGKADKDKGLYKFASLQQNSPYVRYGKTKKHVDMHTVQGMIRKLYGAVERWMFNPKNAGEPKYRSYKYDYSLEGTGPHSSLRWQGDSVKWNNLVIPAIINREDPVIDRGLKSIVKITRIVPYTIRKKKHYKVQLVCEGDAYRKTDRYTKENIVGVDMGPSTIAIVADDKAEYIDILSDFTQEWKLIRVLQRKLDRQTRSNNPHCFDAKGRWIKGQKKVNTKGMLDTRSKLAEVKRKEREHRKNLHGQLVKKIIMLGNDIRVENNPIKAWQSNHFGKSIGKFAPGMLISRLQMELAKYPNSKFTKISTHKTALSQMCICGLRKKKSLNERRHVCSCGVNIQRDIFSAFLARYCTKESLDIKSAEKAFSGMYNVLLPFIKTQ